MTEGLPSDEAVSIAGRHEIKKLRDQLEATENARINLKDTLVAFVQDHIQETISLREFKRKNEPVIQAVGDFLHNVRTRNVAGLDDLACDPSLRQMETALREAVGCLEVLTVATQAHSLGLRKGANDHDQYLRWDLDKIADLVATYRKPRPDARMLAELIYNRLASLPETGWVHGNTFLPANVLCDYHGQQKLIGLIEKTINEAQL